MVPVRFVRKAQREMMAAAKLYDESSEGLGSELFNDVDHAVSIIGQFPLIGSVASKNTRRLMLTRFPYSVIHNVEPDVIYVIAVAHQRRLPGYWEGCASR